MGLIKGTEIKYRSTKHPRPHKYKITVTLPLNIDLSRYDIYCPWVREIEIFGKGSLEVINIDRFLTVLDGRPPLPNLQHLTSCATAPVDGNKLMNFISMFISPSLAEIRTVFPRDGLPKRSISRVPSSSIPAFLRKIQETCPKIRVLEFYPEVDSVDTGSKKYTLSDRCRSILSSFLNLRSFSSTTYLLDFTVLGILGELPCLQSLGIRGFPTELQVLDKKLSIPETWFQSLKELRLHDVHPEDIQTLWNQPTIVQNLVSVLIQTDHLHARNRDDDALYGTKWISPFLEALPHLSPYLQDAYFFVGDEDLRVLIPQDMWKYVVSRDASPGDEYVSQAVFEIAWQLFGPDASPSGSEESE
ncbi:hypothetical protein OPQ81_005980 [Rhizoctonia solani]|nr:hypothetical protein OPQ81_005980 [Rhizoctonia solani]